MCVCVLCPRIDPLRFLAGCRRRRLNQGLVVALDFFSLLDRASFCVIFSVYVCMLCLVRYLFAISASVIDFLGRFIPEMTYYVWSGTLNLTKPNQTIWIWTLDTDSESGRDVLWRRSVLCCLWMLWRKLTFSCEICFYFSLVVAFRL